MSKNQYFFIILLFSFFYFSSEQETFSLNSCLKLDSIVKDINNNNNNNKNNNNNNPVDVSTLTETDTVTWWFLYPINDEILYYADSTTNTLTKIEKKGIPLTVLETFVKAHKEIVDETNKLTLEGEKDLFDSLETITRDNAKKLFGGIDRTKLVLQVWVNDQSKKEKVKNVLESIRDNMKLNTQQLGKDRVVPDVQLPPTVTQPPRTNNEFHFAHSKVCN